MIQRTLLSFSAAWAASACGAGTAGIVTSASDSGGNGNAPASLSLFRVENPRAAPASIRFVLADNEGDATSVELFYLAPGQPLQRITQVPANPLVPPLGVESQIPWDFPAEAGLPDDGRLIMDVGVVARVAGLPDASISIDLGNDPPSISIIDPVQEGSAIVPLRLFIADSSSDVIAVRAEFHRAGDAPDQWTPARPAGIPPGPTPDPALTGIKAESLGVEQLFFWDTDFDLQDLEQDVQLRFTPLDPAAGLAAVAAMEIDNNDAPIAALDSGPLIANLDARRGVPVPFTVIDAEGDFVQTIFQWQRPGADFPLLPPDLADVRAILASPGLRRDFQVCTPYARAAQGRILASAADGARLAELAAAETAFLAAGIEGRTLELLRAPQILVAANQRWSQNLLLAPVACLPLGSGTTALVLDESGGARLREIELATGAVLRSLAVLSGTPTAMALERDERAVLVATDLGGAWKIERVDAVSGTTSLLVQSGPSDPPPPIRALAGLSVNGALATAGDSLLRLDWKNRAAPRSAKVLRGLSTPFGIALDPLRENVAYLAERERGGLGRISVVDLCTRSAEALFVATGAIALDRPEALALENHGTRLLVVMNPGNGSTRRLAAVELGPRGKNRIDPIGAPYGASRAFVAAGADGLRVVVTGQLDELLIAGGVEQRRTIGAYDHSAQRATVSQPFAPLPLLGQAWRFAMDGRIRGSANGKDDAFVWDTRDVPGGGPVLLKAIPFDAERGLASVSGAPKAIRATYDVEPSALGFNLSSAIAADVDRDGATDLVGRGAGGLTIRYQGPARAFGALSAFASIDPSSLFATDVDRDGFVDLVMRDSGTSPGVRILFQTAARVFGTSTLLAGFDDVVVADLDGDGDTDLVTDNGASLIPFLQTSARTFSAGTPLPGSGGTQSFLAADLDHDGDIDLARNDTFGTFVHLQNAGVFVPSTVELNVEEPSALIAADLDGDGALDLAVGDGCDVQLFVSYQAAPGVFGRGVLLADSELLDGSPAPLAADLDGDGDQDLVTRNGNVLLQTQAGLSIDPILLLGRQVFLAADIDGDGALDTHAGDELAYQSTPGALFEDLRLPVPEMGQPDPDPFPIRVLAADLNQDGNLDLVSVNDGTTHDNRRRLTAFFQVSTGSFDLTPLILPRESDGVSFLTADLDADEDADLVQGNRIIRQIAPGSFGASSTSPNAATIGAVADMDGDGDADLVTIAAGITIHFQGPTGTFAASLAVPAALQPFEIAAADVDADGRMDVIASNTGSDDVTVAFQSGPGTFVLRSLPGLIDPQALVAADLDGDGDLDVACLSANALALFAQTSPRTFAAVRIIGGGGESLAAVDFERDGDLDLSTNLAQLLQTSPGRFESVPFFFGSSHLARDVDGDGDPDAASAFDDNDLAVFFGGR